MSLFISLYYLLLLLQTPPQYNHILFISATTPRKPCSKKTQGNFSASLFNGERSIIAWLCDDLIEPLLWYNVVNSAVFHTVLIYLSIRPFGWEHTVFLCLPCPQYHIYSNDKMAEKLSSCMADYAEQARDVAEFTNRR